PSSGDGRLRPAGTWAGAGGAACGVAQPARMPTSRKVPRRPGTPAAAPQTLYSERLIRITSTGLSPTHILWVSSGRGTPGSPALVDARPYIAIVDGTHGAHLLLGQRRQRA